MPGRGSSGVPGHVPSGGRGTATGRDPPAQVWLPRFFFRYRGSRRPIPTRGNVTPGDATNRRLLGWLLANTDRPLVLSRQAPIQGAELRSCHWDCSSRHCAPARPPYPAGPECTRVVQSPPEKPVAEYSRLSSNMTRPSPGLRIFRPGQNGRSPGPGGARRGLWPSRAQDPEIPSACSAGATARTDSAAPGLFPRGSFNPTRLRIRQGQSRTHRAQSSK